MVADVMTNLLRGVMTPASLGVMTLTKLPRRGIHYLPAKPIEPVRPVTGCDTCDNGCYCDSDKGQACEHWCCWGRIPDGLANTCPAVQPHREHMNAYKAYREALYAYQQTSHLR